MIKILNPIRKFLSIVTVLKFVPICTFALPPDIKISDIKTGNYIIKPSSVMDANCGIAVTTDIPGNKIILTSISNPKSRVYCNSEGKTFVIQCDTESAKTGCWRKNINDWFILLHENFVQKSWDSDRMTDLEVSFLPGGQFILTRAFSREYSVFDERILIFFNSNPIPEDPIYFSSWGSLNDSSKTYKANCSEAKSYAIYLAEKECMQYSSNCKIHSITPTTQRSDSSYCGVVVVLRRAD